MTPISNRIVVLLCSITSLNKLSSWLFSRILELPKNDLHMRIRMPLHINQFTFCAYLPKIWNSPKLGLITRCSSNLIITAEQFSPLTTAVCLWTFQNLQTHTISSIVHLENSNFGVQTHHNFHLSCHLLPIIHPPELQLAQALLKDVALDEYIRKYSPLYCSDHMSVPALTFKLINGLSPFWPCRHDEFLEV